MPSVKSNYEVSNISTWEEARRYIGQSLDEIISALNGNLEIGFNLKQQLIPVNFSILNTDQTIVHNLGRVPVGYILVNTNASAVPYNGSVPFSVGTITLKTNVAFSGTILVF